MLLLPIKADIYKNIDYKKILRESLPLPSFLGIGIAVIYGLLFLFYQQNHISLFYFDLFTEITNILLILNVWFLIYIFLIKLDKTIQSETSKRSLLIPLLIGLVRAFIPFFTIYVLIHYFYKSDGDHDDSVMKAYKICTLALITFICLKLLSMMELGLRYKFTNDEKNNLKYRSVVTQVNLLKKMITIVILFFAFASAVSVFDSFRSIGTSLLTSAGVVGAILIFAGQKTINNFLASLQIAFSQPIRIDDVLIVEGEWGRVEEITLTYVSLSLWDQRTLIVPISYFIEKPFQNWTKTRSEITGSVFIFTDYSLPISEVEAYARSICEEAKTLWDRKVFAFQVTNTNMYGIEIRILASSYDASINWDLRCLLRRKIIEFIQEKYPHCFARTRFELCEGQRSKNMPTKMVAPENA